MPVPDDSDDVVLSDVARQGSPTRSWHSNQSPNASYMDSTRVSLGLIDLLAKNKADLS